MTAGSRRELLSVRVAAAVIAVAIVDDAFVHREPGTAPADHLASGLFPPALGLVLLLAYPRVRAGARATIALTWGALAVVFGVAEGVRHVALDRMGGDDVTAILAAVAGVVLLAIGAATLWRSRRRDERLPRRYARRCLVALAAAAAAFLVVVPAGLAIIATHRARSPVARADLGRPYARVAFTTGDGLRLAGWYVPSRNRAAVIAFPGRSGPVPHARMLARRGYGVLLFDPRGTGESEGDANAYGWSGERDLTAAIAFLRGRSDVDPRRIGGLGLSVGGELLMQTAAHSSTLRAVVSEGAGVRSLREHLHTPGLGAVQRWLTPWVAGQGAVAVAANARPPEDLVDLVGRIAPRPVLLIRALNGNEDEVLNRAYYRAAGAPRTLWEVPAGDHTGAIRARPAEYARRVIGFFDAALLGS